MSETLLKLGETTRYGRLIHAKRPRRSQHAACAGERQKMLKVVPIEHAVSMQCCRATWQLCGCRGQPIGTILFVAIGGLGRIPPRLPQAPARRRCVKHAHYPPTLDPP